VSRAWDVAPLIVVGLTLGLLASRWESAVGAVLSLAGLVLMISGLVRWTLRTRRRESVAEVARQPATTSA
jgi:hypothetical protein